MMTISKILFTLVACGTFVFGVVYFFSTPPIWFHGEILQKTALTLDERTKDLLQALYMVIGSTLISFSIAILFIVWTSLKKENTAAKIILLLLANTLSVPLLYVTFSLYLKTGVMTPWIPIAVLLAISYIGALISFRAGKVK